ncbi:hypothetical protein CLIB1444_23S00518 [[Candida] jaroonii]|uniref:Uncharacterized protein n=1 Tax=[Candida] jaroonii TaxID=467808 RepID=A0ACA9YFQ5_9ASCO|nr:hypothetical protein CLIB1444_23S00518 [[Candida] jaroonii]
MDKKFNIILGSSSRSRNGCANCKRSKKKCDEAFPSCGLCSKRKLECRYEIFRSAKIKKVKKGSESVGDKGVMEELENHFDLRDRKGSIEVTDNKEPVIHTVGDVIGHKDEKIQIDNKDMIQNVGETIDHKEIDMIDLGISPGALTRHSPTFSDMMDVPFDFTIQPTSTFNLYLDESGMQFLRYFETTVTKLLTFDSKSSNYFLKTFLPMSLTEESISHALACWGGVFKEKKGLEDSKVKKHLDKSFTLIRSVNQNTNFDLYLLFCFYQIMIGIHVCAGDVINWYKMFETCSVMIRRNGGIGNLLKRFNHSNDCKWFISNHEYHDILNSRAFRYGTHFPIQEYNQLNFFDYGIDPFQGCHNTIILLLGEVLNEKTHLPSLTLQQIWDKFNSLWVKIDNCEPNEYQLNLLDEEDKIIHLNCCKAFKIATKIVLLTYFKKLPPQALDIQLLVIEGLELIEILKTSKCVTSITFPSLIVGINVVGVEREVFKMLLEQIYSFYTVGNLRRVKELIEMYWERTEGEKWVDFVDIVDDLGWELSFC